MNTPISIGLAALILLCVLADAVFNGWGATVFLARKSVDLIDWVAFWR